ncbi:MAG: hypothetical protein ACREUU_21345, partial [Gammaproteobacteria bacterium]
DKGLETISLLREMGWPQGLKPGGRTYTGMLLRVAGELRRRDRQEEAKSLLLEALPVARRDDTKEIQASILLDIAAIDFAGGREEQGLERCRLAAEANPTAARVYFLCSVTRPPDPSSRLEWHRGRVEAFRAALRADPTQYRAKLQLAHALRSFGMGCEILGRRAEAREAIDESASLIRSLLQINPREPGLQSALERSQRALARLDP